MTLLSLVLALTPSIQAVEYDHAVEFSRYKTWSWQAGVVVPSDAVPDQRIREALVRGLAARGLSEVASDATLIVRYHAARRTRTDLPPFDSRSGAPPTGIRFVETGSLVIDLLDAASGKVVWRGHAADVLTYGPNEIAAQIDGAVAALLAQFPPAIESRP